MAKAVSLADALFLKLEASIMSGKLAPGSRLPTQKAIAEEEDVSRTVVREAVARLEAQGIAIARQGSGVFVAEDARYQAFQVRRQELSEIAGVIKLLEMRLAIEAEMAAFAAARREMSDIDSMQAALRDIAAMQDDPVAAAEADMRFHLSIARATRNENFPRLIDFMGVRLVPPRNLYLRDQPPSVHQEYVERVRKEHEDILDAIIRMNPVRARAAARRHMQESLIRHTELGEAMSRTDEPEI